MIAHLLACPACGPFGIRARRRNRRAADIGLINFHAQLAAEVRSERSAGSRPVNSTFVMPPASVTGPIKFSSTGSGRVQVTIG